MLIDCHSSPAIDPVSHEGLWLVSNEVRGAEARGRGKKTGCPTTCSKQCTYP